ncbi:MAG: hypothetical protein AABY05_00365 [Nanoarchaeota archaeon]
MKGGKENISIMIGKKGLSSVIATVLIVLLSLVAVTLLWTFIRGGIEQSSSAVEVSNKCLNTEIRPTNCVVDKTAGNADVIVRSTRGEAEKLVLILERNDGTTSVSAVSTDVPANTLETKPLNDVPFAANFIVPGTDTFKLKVAAVFTDSTGKDAFCDPSPVVVACS